jgi:pimeloyl-ACP methyl ester carboxylesterase
MVHLFAPHEQRTVRLSDGFLIDTLIVNPGCAKRLVFFHGINSTPDAVAMLDPLAKAHNLTIYAPSLPCHGSTHNVSTFTDLVGRLEQWCDALGLSHDVMLGHSLGAMVLPYLAKSRPDLVSAMICLAMPTRQVVSNFDFATRLVVMTVDSWVSSLIALGQTLIGRHHPADEPCAHPAHVRCRTLSVLRILRHVPDMAPVVDHLEIPMALIYGAIDFATRPPHARLGLPKPIILDWKSHGFPSFDRTWSTISDVIGGVLLPPPRLV